MPESPGQRDMQDAAHAIGTLIDAAYEYGFPVYEIARTRHADLVNPDPALRMTPNTVWHDHRLCDHTTRWITTPNNDTLYSRAWIDLSGGPVRVAVDRLAPGRYWSVAFMDVFSNNFAMLGTRLDGVGPVSVHLVGPRHRHLALPGRVIHAPGDDVWLFARWIVEGLQDLPAARAMQQTLSVHPTGPAKPPTHEPAEVAGPRDFLAVVNERLARNPPPQADHALLDRAAAVGVRAGDPSAGTSLPEAMWQAWHARWPLAQRAVRRQMVTLTHDAGGWMVRGPEIGDFGTQYGLRAAIALGGLGALAPIEAVYASRNRDAHGQRLEGTRRYRLRVAAPGLPTDAFWSLSMYAPDVDGRLFFTGNPIDRYTIGDRTPGLVHATDGSLEIALQHEPPSDAMARANWLPSPAGPFVLTLRAYLPRPELREWRCAMPSLETLV